jgi:hypothetical protein
MPPLRRGVFVNIQREDIHDLYDAITGLGIELEALNMSVRALTAHLIGEDPLRDSLYYGGPAEEGAAPEPPPWMNAARQASLDEQDEARHAFLVEEQIAGVSTPTLYLVACFTCVLLALGLVLYLIGS